MTKEAMDLITGELVQVEFYTAWARPIKDESEFLSQEGCKTERAYIDPTSQIREMEEAGKLLLESRKARFDTDLVSDPMEKIVTMGPVHDVADVVFQAQALDKQLRAKQEVFNEKQAEKAAKDAAAAQAATVEEMVNKRLAEIAKASVEGA
ncbi:MAG: hypothetical protein [Microvirus sp.]|nr:MAG: hypothetical protein [Microvirus sp.]